MSGIKLIALQSSRNDIVYTTRVKFVNSDWSVQQ